MSVYLNFSRFGELFSASLVRPLVTPPVVAGRRLLPSPQACFAVPCGHRFASEGDSVTAPRLLHGSLRSPFRFEATLSLHSTVASRLLRGSLRSPLRCEDRPPHFVQSSPLACSTGRYAPRSATRGDSFLSVSYLPSPPRTSLSPPPAARCGPRWGPDTPAPHSGAGSARPRATRGLSRPRHPVALGRSV